MSTTDHQETQAKLKKLQQANKSRTQLWEPSKEEILKAQVLWLGMAELYEEQFTNKYGIDPDPFVNRSAKKWIRALSGVSVKQVQNGIKKVLESGRQYPPNVVVFRELCLQKTFNDHVEEIVAQERERSERLSAPSSKEVAFEHIQSIKQHNAEARKRIAQEETEREGGC